MTLEAVIFDFGGVLVRTEAQSGRQKWEAELGLPEGGLAQTIYWSEASYRACLGQVPEESVWQHVSATFGLDAEQLSELRRDFWSDEQLDVELVEFLRQLRPRYKTAILSNAWSGARAAFTQAFELDRVVGEMIISAEEGVAKPDPRIYHIAVERLGVQPEEAVFVDDLAENVEGARAVGMKGIQFKSTTQVIAAVRQYLDEST
jgi:epoxide hydrolase-like predicted phosphatase